jgi:uncharacterized protein YqjF (DUF2071 family)
MALPSLVTSLQSESNLRRAVMFQKRRELLFLHREVEVEAIPRTLPPGLQGNTFAGNAYLALTPFFMYDAPPLQVFKR